MNINGRIHTGLSHSHRKNIQGKMKIDSVMRIWRRRLEARHNLQYPLLRQKTPPVMKNRPKVAAVIYK